MKEILTQYTGKDLTPYTEKDREALKGYKPNQILKAKISGTEKNRSYPQLQRYWVLMTKLAQFESDHTEQYTREDMDFKVWQTAVAQLKDPGIVLERWVG